MNELFDFNLNDVVREMYEKVSKENKELKEKDFYKYSKELENEIISLKSENEILKNKLKAVENGDYEDLINILDKIKKDVFDYDLHYRQKYGIFS